MKKILMLLLVAGLPIIAFSQNKMESPSAGGDVDVMFTYAVFEAQIADKSKTIMLRLQEDEGRLGNKFSEMKFPELEKFAKLEFRQDQEVSFFNYMGAYGWELTAVIPGNNEKEQLTRYIFKRAIR